MPNTDGSIVIGVDLSLTQAEKQLRKFEGKVEETEQEINDLTVKRDEAQETSGDKAIATLEAEKKKLDDMKAAREEYNKKTREILSTSEKIEKISSDLAQKEAKRADLIGQSKELFERLAVEEGKLSETKNLPVRDKEHEREQKEAVKILQREWNAVENKIEQYNEKIKQSNALLAEQKSALNIATTGFDPNEVPSDKSISNQSAKVKELQSELNAAANAAKKYDDQLLNAKMELEQNKAKAGQLADSIAQANKPAERFKQHMQDAGKDVDKLGNRIKKLVSRVMVFSVFTLALRSMRTWMVNVIKTNDQATQAMAKLKGALLTLAQPLVNIIIPAFITFVQVLTNVVAVAAQILSSLFGTTVEESAEAAKNLQAEQEALKGVGKAAKGAGKQLASFDEINQIQKQDVGGSADTEIAPDFDFSFPEIEEADKFLNAIKLIGAALLAWKLSDGFLDGLTKFAGLVIAIKGATEFAKNLWDAWENGFSLDNLIGAVLGATAVVIGLQLAFGNVGGAAGLLVSGLLILVTAIKDITENGLTLENGLAALVGVFMMVLGVGKLVGASFGTIAAAALVVASGIAMMVIGFQDATKNGWNLENMLTAVAGIILTGLGISLLVGSWIPALVAAIAGLLLAITVFAGNGEELIENLKNVFSGLIEFVTGAFTGDWERAWEGVKKIFTGLWNSIVIVIESAINIMIKGINWLISKLNTISFEVPDWVPLIGGQTWGINIEPVGEVKLPRLAQGAVIPPNREFMAVLGDQKNGTNIEAPANLIRQMVAEGMRAAGGGVGSRDMTIILQLDRRELGRAVYTLNNEETQRVGVRLAGVRT